MEKLSYSDIVSTLAFITALSALVWNVARDYLADKEAIKPVIAFGQIGKISNSNTGLFADAGSLLPIHKFDNPGMLVSIVNTGRKPIGISNIGGRYSTKADFSISLIGLPKVLNPYEVFSTTSSADLDFVKKVSRKEIKKIWVTDTTGKKWSLSRKAWKRLRKTAEYIDRQKHL